MSLDYSDALIGGGFNFRCGLVHHHQQQQQQASPSRAESGLIVLTVLSTPGVSVCHQLVHIAVCITQKACPACAAK
jgi:hypothetical protein